MKCPKCRYVSHDYLDACRKCNTDLVEFKQKFKLMVLKPGDLDLGVLVATGRENVADRDRFSVEAATADTPPGKFYLGLDEMTAATEIDMQFDPDTPSPSTAPGELTKTFYVPEVLAKPTSDVDLPNRAAGVDKTTVEIEIDIQLDSDTPEPLAKKTTDCSNAEPAGTVPLATPAAAAQDAPPAPMQTIDISVGNLANGFDEMTAATEADMQFAPDTPRPSTAPGELTKTFYVELDELTAATEVDMQIEPDTPSPLAEKTTQRSDAEPAGMVPLANPEAAAQDAPPAPVKTIDISVGNLDNGFDEFEDIQLDTSEIDLDVDFAHHLSSTTEIAHAFDDDIPSLSEKRSADTETGRMSALDVREDGENI